MASAHGAVRIDDRLDFILEANAVFDTIISIANKEGFVPGAALQKVSTDG